MDSKISLGRLLLVTSVAGGVQFGWAIQLSLLTPYVQELGIPHAFASLVWLCGPLCGLLVQPVVGHFSDNCRSRFGRRRPYIVGGALSIVVAVLLVGFSADIGGLLGDPVDAKRRPRAIVVYILGFWVLDVGNNVTQGPCRALLADLTAKDDSKIRIANSYYSLFMALGNVLGYATGSYGGWYTVLPFTTTKYCSKNCANLKSTFLIDVLILLLTTCISITSVKEVCLSKVVVGSPEEGQGNVGSQREAFVWELFGTIKHLKLPIWIVLIVTVFSWIGWFPFFLYDTDWFGREIYKGDPNGGPMYHTGVRMGALALMANSVVLGVTSILVDKICRKLGASIVWGISNLVMAICFVAMLVISHVATKLHFPPSGAPPTGLVAAAIVVFAVLGAPLAITFSVPYAIMTSKSEPLGLGQGLVMGILNIAIVIPQMVVSLGSGPLDQLFGSGNSPAFAVGAVATVISGSIAIFVLRRQR